ncbi:L-asparaginase [Amycolatopsis arida]|uniref:L-asparaginase n=1 Tax=Amycolatopsis arida TaxID=587909 RepID=A0A1I5P815_9PSEU|nr:asparaginase [Amycolatopsis arida]TDX98394.1 L-asparaginase [Amycolatopsis arida]SFP30097.1 L-asparaginase [Amycolatopsis arida]
MARVLLVSTGDTIAHRQHSGRPAIATATELLAAVAAHLPTVDVRGEDVMAEPSWDTSPATMLALARRVRAALVDDGFDGVVVAHGVDTLEETAFLTDLMAGPAATRGGIVFTGATRCLDDPAADGPANLASAITAAADPATRGLGALVCFDRRLHAARWASLADISGASAFSSAPHPPLGHVTRAGRVTITAAPPARPAPVEGAPESDVALIKTYPGVPPALLTTAADAGARGIVLEGTGAGNVPVELFTTIGELTEWDIPIVLASRARTAPAALDDTHAGTGLATKVGAIGARGLGPTQARVALMVALGAGGVTAVRDWFAQL